MKTPTSGTVESQVFQGTGAASGLYAYAFQFTVYPVTDSSGQPTSVNSASLQFNASPITSNFLGGSESYQAYVIKDGQVGQIDAPAAAPVRVEDGEVERLAEVIKAARFSWTTGSDGDFDRHLASCVLRDRAERVAGEGER